MLLSGSSLTVGEMDESPITTLSLATPFLSVHESVPESTTVHKSASASLSESVPERPPTPVPVVSNQSVLVPESSYESVPASVFHPDSLTKMAATPETWSTTGAMLEPMSKMELRLKQTRLMSSVADPPLRSR